MNQQRICRHFFGLIEENMDPSRTFFLAVMKLNNGSLFDLNDLGLI